MILLAQFSLVVAILCAAYAAIAAIVALRKHSAQWLASAVHAVIALAGSVTLAEFLLFYFLLSRDFRLAYVVRYVNLALHPIYLISALWAGQEGSLLFWVWMLAIFAVVSLRNAQRNNILHQYGLRRIPPDLRYLRSFSAEHSFSVLVCAIVLGFFLIVLAVHANPFSVLPSPPLNGNGLNPLLQNFYMVSHPPLLFIGYAGFGVAFVLAFSALCTGRISKEWVTTMRRWVLFSWYFLGMGIILGARWAYLELGWGGYWDWDPVENSSLIPWLTSTALLHALILQQRKGVFARWNIFLSIITFQLCVFGTFITRSGVLDSVHAYAQSPSGRYFLIFLLGSMSAMVGLFLYRWRHFQHPPFQTALLSKENSFFLTNQLLMGLSFAVLYGTIFPILAALFGKNVVIEEAFFTRISIPLGLVILGLIGVCQGLPWKQFAGHVEYTTFLVPIVLSLLLVGGLRLTGVTDWLVLLSCGLGGMVAATMLQNLKQFVRPFALFHLGIAILLVSIAVSSTYKQEQTAKLYPGESFSFGHIRFHYLEKRIDENAERGLLAAVIELYNKDRFIATVTPEKRFYGDHDSPQTTTEVGLYSSLQEDIYVVLDGWDEDDRAYFTFIVSPLILWLWIGGLGGFTLGMLLMVFSWARFRL